MSLPYTRKPKYGVESLDPDYIYKKSDSDSGYEPDSESESHPLNSSLPFVEPLETGVSLKALSALIAGFVASVNATTLDLKAAQNVDAFDVVESKRLPQIEQFEAKHNDMNDLNTNFFGNSKWDADNKQLQQDLKDVFATGDNPQALKYIKNLEKDTEVGKKLQRLSKQSIDNPDTFYAEIMVEDIGKKFIKPIASYKKVVNALSEKLLPDADKFDNAANAKEASDIKNKFLTRQSNDWIRSVAKGKIAQQLAVAILPELTQILRKERVRDTNEKDPVYESALDDPLKQVLLYTASDKIEDMLQLYLKLQNALNDEIKMPRIEKDDLRNIRSYTITYLRVLLLKPDLTTGVSEFQISQRILRNSQQYLIQASKLYSKGIRRFGTEDDLIKEKAYAYSHSVNVAALLYQEVETATREYTSDKKYLELTTRIDKVLRNSGLDVPDFKEIEVDNYEKFIQTFQDLLLRHKDNAGFLKLFESESAKDFWKGSQVSKGTNFFWKSIFGKPLNEEQFENIRKANRESKKTDFDKEEDFVKAAKETIKEEEDAETASFFASLPFADWFSFSIFAKGWQALTSLFDGFKDTLSYWLKVAGAIAILGGGVGIGGATRGAAGGIRSAFTSAFSGTLRFIKYSLGKTFEVIMLMANFVNDKRVQYITRLKKQEIVREIDEILCKIQRKMGLTTKNCLRCLCL